MSAYTLFSELARAVKFEYKKNPRAQSHGGFEHDFMVASLALRIAPDAQTGRLAAAAGFCHSADHLVGKRPEFDAESPQTASFTATDEDLETLVRRLLEETVLNAEERDAVVDVVLHHEGANREDDSLLKITLCDADRLANMQATLPMRSARFSQHLLLVDPIHFERDPDANYRNPKSVIWDVANSMGWANEHGPYILRLPKARCLGTKYARRLAEILSWVREDYADAGLVPYPEF